jgi:hypothetical protein
MSLLDGEIIDLGDGTLKTSIPLKDMNQGWYINLLHDMDRMSLILTDLKGSTDMRPYFMARWIIMKIDDEKIRVDILKKFDDAVKDIRLNSTLSNEEKGEYLILTSQNACGPVISWIGEHMPLSKTNVIPKV